MLSLCCGCNEGDRGGWEGGREEVGERKREGGGRGREDGGREGGRGREDGGRREGGKEAGEGGWREGRRQGREEGGRGRRDHVNAQYANSVQSPEHWSVQACSTQVS